MLDNKLDPTDKKILALLLENGRLSFAEIGRQVGLSLPAASERVRRLEDAGYISGYQAKLNFKKLGYPITVFIQLMIPPQRYEWLSNEISNTPEIIEAHHVAGELSCILKLRLDGLEKLEPNFA
ncbi:MAG: Lrp/AsnC family transcriptional regulator, partial [Chloroflexota bacterium]